MHIDSPQPYTANHVIKTSAGLVITSLISLLLWAPAPAHTAYINPDEGPRTVTAGEASLTMNPESPGRITDWSVGGVGHLATQEFWFRIGDDGPERPISQIGNEPTVEYHEPCTTCTNDARHAVMAISSFQYDIEDFVVGLFMRLSSDSTEDHSELLMSISPQFIHYTTGRYRPPIEIHVFQLVHFDFFGASMNSTVEVDNNTTITQTATQGPSASVTQTLTSVPASHIQVGDYESLAALFQDNQPTTLNDFTGPFESTSAAWLLQWDVTIDPEAPENPFISTFTLDVPEPTTALYSALALAMLYRSRQLA